MGGDKRATAGPLSTVLVARFDVYPNPDGVDFLLDVQANLLDGFNTRVVVPLMPATKAPMPAKRLNPVFDIEGESCVMATQLMAAGPVAILKAPIASLAGHDAEIGGARWICCSWGFAGNQYCPSTRPCRAIRHRIAPVPKYGS